MKENNCFQVVKILKRISVVSLLTLSTVFFTSCSRYASEKDLNNISLYMDKQSIIQTMSSKGVARGAIVNKHGQIIEVREYEISVFRPFIGTNIDLYWLYFCDGKLVQWGKAGDWEEAKRMIYDINFNVAYAN